MKRERCKRNDLMISWRSCRGLFCRLLGRLGLLCLFGLASASAFVVPPVKISSLNQCYDRLPLHAEVQTTRMHGGRLEAILQFDPDLVLANRFNSPLLIARLRERDVEVLVLPEPESLAEVAEFYARLGVAGVGVSGGGASDAASGAIGVGSASDLEDAGSGAGGVSEALWPQVWQGQRVLMLQANHYSFGQGTLWDELVSALGGQNIAPGSGLVSVLPEQVLALDPDVIVSVQGDEFALASRNSLHGALAPLLENRGVVVSPQWMGCMAQQLDALVDVLVEASGRASVRVGE